jgi:hypothetical protein
MYPSNELLKPNTTKTEYLFIDTRIHDPDIGNKVTFEETDKLKFRIKFNETASLAVGQLAHSLTPGIVYKNIKSVELCGMSFSKEYMSNVSQNLDYEYLIIDIEELSGRVHSNSQFANGSFAILYMEDLKAYHKGADFFEKIKTFNPPLSLLSSLNVRVLTPSNDLLAVPLNGSVTMMFKIITVV